MIEERLRTMNVVVPVVEASQLLLLVAVSVSMLLVGCRTEAPLCGSFPLTNKSKDCILSHIDQITARYNFFEDFKEEVSLEQFHNELYNVDSNLDDIAYLKEVKRVVASLKDGHTSLVIHAQTTTEPAIGRPAVTLHNVGETVIVASSESDDGLRPGDVILQVDGVAAGERLERLMEQISASTDEARRRIAAIAMLNGPVDKPVRVVVDRDGEKLTLPYMAREPFLSIASSPWSERFGTHVGYLRIETFSFLDDMEKADELLNGLMDTSGLIIDVRGNGGGQSFNADLVLGRLISAKLKPFRLLDEQGEELCTFQPSPRGREPYGGDLVVLSDALTFSAANYFVHRVHHHGLAVVIGEKTGGGAASKTMVEIVDGVYLTYSWQLIVDSTGEHSEGGIVPHVEVGVTREELADGALSKPGDPAHDKILTAAIQHLNGGN